MATSSQLHGGAVGSGLKFLIVDDDAYYARQLREQIFRACGRNSKVHQVSTIDSALQELNAHNFDVCFLSYALAESQGLQDPKVARFPKLMTAMIFVAENPSKKAALQALSFGAKDFLVKSSMSDFDVAKSVSYTLYWKCREIELEAAIMRDQVTGLNNTPMFDEHLRHSLELARRNREKVGLLMIGLTDMEPVEEDYGVEVSGKLLKQVGERISAKVRSTDVVARVSNREFAAILSKVSSSGVVKTLSGSIASAISERPYEIDGYALKISATVGASTFPDDGDNIEDLKSFAKDSLVDLIARKEDANAFRPFNYY
ncbi:MAG: diguanylate cyclase [Magnetovibrio sp.]|nr:diguanylate cyclase [Magnetovibrio sp.]